MKPHLLITAVPGAGKTTVIRRVAGELDAKTPQVVIAHVDFPKTYRVGKYGVDVAAIDAAVDAALAPRRDTTLYLVDEIGKMECLSERFVGLRAVDAHPREPRRHAL